MNASFVVQGLGMLLGGAAAEFGAAVRRRPARRAGPARPPGSPGCGRLGAVLTRAGAGTIVVGLVPEDAGSGLHFAGAVMYFIGGALALLLLGALWLRQTPLGWFILACGVVSAGRAGDGGLTGMDVPEPGTLERFMGYPVTMGLAAAGLVIAQRVHRHRKAGAQGLQLAGPGGRSA